MADDRNDSRVDLNLYLGLSRSPRVQISDLGSDLALSSLPRSPRMSNSSSIDMPYSPSHAIYTPESNVPPSLENTIQEHTLYMPSNEPYDPNNPEAEEPPSPIAPSYIPLDSQEPVQDIGSSGSRFRPYTPSTLNNAATSMYAPHHSSYMPRPPSYSPPPLPNREDESSSRRHLYDSPEFRFRRLIESDRRLRPRRFPALPHSSSERPAFVRSYSPDQQLVDDLMSSEVNLEANGKHKIKEEITGLESSDDEKEDENKNAADFECNICFELAQQPVVTSCGHLFCWPCLYQWLNVHSEHKECPVCKGEVTESNITPIYGRGSSEVVEEKTYIENGESNVKIPPRPRGNRFESLRQQFRPISRRFGEGISASWARLMQQAMHSSGNRFDAAADPTMLNSNNGARAVLTRQTRQRTRRILRGLIAESGSETRDHSLPNLETNNAGPIFDEGNTSWGQDRESAPNNDPLLGNAMDLWSRDGLILPRINDMPSIFRDGPEIWRRYRDTSSSANPFVNEADRAELLQRVSAYSMLAREDIRRVVGTNRYASINPTIPEQVASRNNVVSTTATDQVSVSSTTATIQGDVGVQVEPNSVGSSRPYRRRERNGASGSLDMDEVLHPSKRRRFN